jgi:hypothetical protein
MSLSGRLSNLATVPLKFPIYKSIIMFKKARRYQAKTDLKNFKRGPSSVHFKYSTCMSIAQFFVKYSLKTSCLSSCIKVYVYVTSRVKNSSKNVTSKTWGGGRRGDGVREGGGGGGGVRASFSGSSPTPAIHAAPRIFSFSFFPAKDKL